MKGFVLVLALLATLALWIYSHLAPETVGVCHEVALNLGKNPTIRDCQPYEFTEFIVPLGIIAILVLGVSRDGDIEIELPGLGTFKRTRAKEAAKALKQESDLEERGRAFVETVAGQGPP